MDIEIWHVWVIASLLLFIVEIFMPTFVAACLAMGCLASGLMSCAGFGVKVQLTAFSIVTLAVFFGIRPFMLKYAHGKTRPAGIDAKALAGKIGTVTRAVDNSKKLGSVSIEGEEWRAESENGSMIRADEKVVVVRNTGTMAVVKKIKKEN